MTTLKTCRIFVLKKLIQIQKQVFWYEFNKDGKKTKLDNEVLADKNELNNNKAESHMIVDLVISALQLLLFLA